MVSVFTYVVDRGFEPRPCETNEDESGIYFSSAKYVTFKE